MSALEKTRPRMLWIDCIASARDPGLRDRCEEFFAVDACDGTENVARLIGELQPGALCFDFDYPLEPQLHAMQTIKRNFPGLPVLMLTVEHSEALAVWAFRARVWNYIAKPVAMQEWRANLQSLARIAVLGPKHRRAVRLAGPAVAALGNPSRADTSYAAVLPAIEYIERHYNARLSAAKVAGLCGMSPFRFSREFHQAVGCTFQDHVLRYRIAEACRLIRQRPDMPIGDICFAVGFNDSSYFARIFKRYMSMKPTEFARTQGGGPQAVAPAMPRRVEVEALLPPNQDLPPLGVSRMLTEPPPSGRTGGRRGAVRRQQDALRR